MSSNPSTAPSSTERHQATTDLTPAPGRVVVDGLWKAFYDQRRKSMLVAVNDANFVVEPGEFVCICGPSGCGKSTILRILAGLESSSSGTASVGSQGSRPAMVFQEASVFPWLSVEDNVGYPLKLNGMRRKQRRELVDPLLEMMNLTDFRHSFPHQLSGGMKQRTSVARALVDSDSEVLLMDEPFGALDEQTRVKLQQELLAIWERDRKTVVFITHSVDEALTLADRVIVMSARPGRIIDDIKIPFERPRDVLELRRMPEFGEITFRIWQLLKDNEAADDDN